MVCTLKEQFSFIYKAKLDNDLFEHELDHVFFGKSNEKPVPNKDEVADYKYLSIKSIQQDLIHNSNRALLVRGVAGTVLRKLDAVVLPSCGKDVCLTVGNSFLSNWMHASICPDS